jgi:pyruvate-formate lyase-activating enzyme
MAAQGYESGDCQVTLPGGRRSQPACVATLRRAGDMFHRRIESAHLSRPEHYLSIYQSGCNHTCLKCHSWEFSQYARGTWVSTKGLARIAAAYAGCVTVREPRERATAWHGTGLCRSCGQCFLYGERGALCPGVLTPGQVVLGPQGFGPARNIVAFTGGDIACRADYYAEATRRIKEAAPDLWVLLETNGFGLTPANLDLLAEAGLDAFWLDIKAYDPDTYRQLCGTAIETVLQAPAEIVRRGFTLEVLTVYVPGWVETGQIRRIAALVAEADPTTPYTVLAFFPAYHLRDVPPPTLEQMLAAYQVAREEGLEHVKLGNPRVFARTEADWETLVQAVGAQNVG